MTDLESAPKTEHTPEAWEMPERAYRKADGDGDNFSGGDWIISPPLGEAGPVAIASSEADARRIVACVNACAGISTENLESGSVESLVEALRGLKNEVHGAMAYAGPRLREIIGNTNAACIERRLDDADSVLAALAKAGKG